MADQPHPRPGGDGARARTGLPAWVWIVMVLVAVVAAMGSAWWVESDDAAVPADAPGRPEQFCNTVGELQGQGEVRIAVGEQTTGLEPSIEGLQRLLAAEPPTAVGDDIEQLVGALEAVQAEATAVAADDTDGLQRVNRVLEDRLRGLQGESDRIDAYTERWCGASLNPTPPG